MKMRSTLAAVLAAAVAAGCDPDERPDPVPPPEGPVPPGDPPAPAPPVTSPPPGPRAIDRAAVARLGGAGDEWAHALLAAPDGSVVAVVSSGPAQPPPVPEDDDPTTPEFDGRLVYDTLRLVKLGPALEPIWSREVGTTWAYVDVRAAPAGGTLAVVRWSAAPLDLGGGGLERGVVELGPSGEHVRQWEGPATDAAAGASGDLLVGWGTAPFTPWIAGAAAVSLYGPGGCERWSRDGPARASTARVAASPDGGWIVGWMGESAEEPDECSAELEKLGAEGDTEWRLAASRCGGLHVAADGAVVLGVYLNGELTVGDLSVRHIGPGVYGAVAVIGADGRPLAVWKRSGYGPVAAGAADGTLAFLEFPGGGDYGGTTRFIRNCSTELVVRSRAGEVLSRRAIAICTSRGGAWWEGGGAWWEHVGAFPDGSLAILGDATALLEVAGQSLVPEGRDAFLVRVAP